MAATPCAAVLYPQSAQPSTARAPNKRGLGMASDDASGNGISEKLLGLSNDLLQVKLLKPGLIEFRHTSETKSFLGSKKKSFEARAKLDPANHKVDYWQTVQGSSVGLSSESESSSVYGSNMVKFSSFVVKGVDRSGSGAGFSPDGDKFKYDLGKVRDLVKSIAEETGWKIGNTMSKP